MDYTPSRVIELVKNVSWESNSQLRIFWIRCTQSRDVFAKTVRQNVDEALALRKEKIIPIVLRNNFFQNPNSLLSDAQALFALNREHLTLPSELDLEKVTVLIIAKNEFRMTQCSSPIVLPDWFPVSPGTETFFTIADLAKNVEIDLLTCEEARIDHVSELFFKLESALVAKMFSMHATNSTTLDRFCAAICEPGSDSYASILKYKAHLESVQDSRAYRPSASGDSKFLAARILKLVLNNSPKAIALKAKECSDCFGSVPNEYLKPTLFALMFSPAAKMDPSTASWHAIFLSLFQGYQLMNGAAHCGEYPKYSVALQYANSINLREFYESAREYIENLVLI